VVAAAVVADGGVGAVDAVADGGAAAVVVADGILVSISGSGKRADVSKLAPAVACAMVGDIEWWVPACWAE